MNNYSQIQTLPKEDGDLIKATVTISSVSHCLRELIENSLDAGSKIISIKINNCGLESIIVSDDGCGISQLDLDKICYEGATSKDLKLFTENDHHEISIKDLKSAEDLNSNNKRIKCFNNYSGGRGRALGAISNLSYLTIESSWDNSGSGFRLTFSSTGERIIEKISKLKGTTVSVQSLFYGYPVRRRHLLEKRIDEFRDIEEVITGFAISTKATINVSVDRKTVNQIHSANIVHRIKSVLGSEVVSHLIHGKVDLSEWSQGAFLDFYSTPLDGNLNGRIYTSVNGRPTVNMNIIRGIRSEYRICNGNKWPIVCLLISSPARESFEFTPDSPFVCTEFVNEEELKSMICMALHAAWVNDTSITSSFLEFSLVGEMDFSSKNSEMKPKKFTRFKSTIPSCLNRNIVISDVSTDKIIERTRKTRFEYNGGLGFRNTVIKKSSFAQMDIIGQWNKSFIVARLGPDVFAIDQHAASEATFCGKSKIDKMNKDYFKSKKIQNLLKPVVIEISPEDAENARISMERCRKLGFDYEIVDFNQSQKEIELQNHQPTNQESNKSPKEEFNQINQEKPFEINQEKSFEINREKTLEINQEKSFETNQEKPFEINQEESFKTNQEKTFETNQKESFETNQEKQLEINQEKPFKFSQDEFIQKPRFGLLVKSIPADKSVATGISDLQDTISVMRFEPEQENCQTQKSRSKAMRRSCRTSVKVGDSLSRQMMKNILNEMAASESPWNSRNGKPTWCCIEAL